MGTITLKKYLVSKINLIDDDLVLNKIKKVLDKSEKVYMLSDAQLKSIEESDKQLLSGNYIDQDVMDKRVLEWQNAK